MRSSIFSLCVLATACARPQSAPSQAAPRTPEPPEPAPSPARRRDIALGYLTQNLQEAFARSPERPLADEQLEEENAKLKRLVADLSLDKAMLQDVLAKKL